MAEAIAIISFVSAVVALVDIGSRVVIRLNGFQSKSHEMPDALRHIKVQLPLTIDSLRLSKAKAESGELSTESQNALMPALEACTKLIDRLDQLLTKLLPVEGDSSWLRRKKALRSLSKDHDIQDLREELDRYIAVLTLHRTSHLVTRSFAPVQSLSVRTIPATRDVNFVDRPELFSHLEATLGKHGRAALSGIGGVGKTQIAIEYCYRQLDRESAGQVFWIYSNSVKKLSEGCKNIAEALQLPGWNDPKTSSIQLFQNYLAKHGTMKDVVVLDNVDDITILDENLDFRNDSITFADLVHRASSTQVLVTTRDRRVGERLAVRGATTFVQNMSLDEAIQLLESYLPRTAKTDLFDHERLVESLDYLPLAITQAAAYITEDCINVGEYLSLLQEGDEQLEQLLGESLSDSRRSHQESNSPFKTWKISFDHIVETDPRASEMLSLMACFDRNNIQPTLLRRETEPQRQFLKASATLQNFSLISKDPESNAYKMHRLVQIATQAWTRVQNSDAKVRREAVTILATLFPPGEYETWRECEALLPHTRLVMSQTHDEPDDIDLQFANLLTKLAWFYRCQCRYTESIAKAQAAFVIYKRVKGQNDPDALINMVTEVDCRIQLLENVGGRNPEDVLREISASLETQLGLEHPETLRSLRILAFALHNEGLRSKVVPEEAIALFRKILRLYEQVLGPNHRKSMSTKNGLALALDSGWQFARDIDGLVSTEEYDALYKESEHLLRECLHLCTQNLGPEHPKTWVSQGNLAASLVERGAYEEAELLIRSTLALRAALFGPLDVDSISCNTILSRCLEHQGLPDEATRIARETVALSQSVLGPSSTHTILTRIDLARLLFNAGDYSGSVEQYALALLYGKSENPEPRAGLEHILPEASDIIVELALTKAPSGEKEGSLQFQHRQSLSLAIRHGTSGWHRDDLDDVQILRLLCHASKDIIDDRNPLPQGWEIRLTKSNRVYFADQRTKATSWRDPRLSSSNGTGNEISDSPIVPSFYSEHVSPSALFRSPESDRPFSSALEKMLTASRALSDSSESDTEVVSDTSDSDSEKADTSTPWLQSIAGEYQSRHRQGLSDLLDDLGQFTMSWDLN